MVGWKHGGIEALNVIKDCKPVRMIQDYGLLVRQNSINVINPTLSMLGMFARLSRTAIWTALLTLFEFRVLGS